MLRCWGLYLKPYFHVPCRKYVLIMTAVCLSNSNIYIWNLSQAALKGTFWSNIGVSSYSIRFFWLNTRLSWSETYSSDCSEKQKMSTQHLDLGSNWIWAHRPSITIKGTRLLSGVIKAIIVNSSDCSKCECCITLAKNTMHKQTLYNSYTMHKQTLLDTQKMPLTLTKIALVDWKRNVIRRPLLGIW